MATIDTIRDADIEVFQEVEGVGREITTVRFSHIA